VVVGFDYVSLDVFAIDAMLEMPQVAAAEVMISPRG
jgi:hypothetical protein